MVCLPLLQADCLKFAFSIQIQLKQYWVVCIREKVLMNFMLVHKRVVPQLKRTKSVFWLHFLLKSNWSNREKNTGKFLFKSEYHSIRDKTMFIPININHFSHIDKPIKALIISWVWNWKKHNYDSHQIWHLHKAYMYLNCPIQT